MESSLALSLGLPAALVIIMLGLGLSLRLKDFADVLARPKPVFIGIACHVVLLPALCFVLVTLASVPSSVSVGMMLLAASPGATSAAIYAHLGRGDVALSLVMAGVTTLLALATLPLIVNFSLGFFYGAASELRVEVAQVLQIFALAIVPALIGALIHNRYPAIAQRLEKPVKLLATIFLAGVVIFALIGQWELLTTWGASVGIVALVYNVVSLAVGYCVPLLLGVERRQAIALAMSLSLHNAALVIAMAMSTYMLDDPELAIAPAAYGIIAYMVGAIFLWIVNRQPAAVR